MKSYYLEILEIKEEIRKQILSPVFDIQVVESLLNQFDELCAFERELMNCNEYKKTETILNQNTVTELVYS